MSIDAQELTRSFGRTPALDGVTLGVQPGERVAVVGRNGAGKTTLLRVLATVLPAESGRATICGFDLFADQTAIRAVTGYLPEGDPADHALTAREWLRFRGRLRRMTRRRLRRRMHEVASFFGLGPLLGTGVGALSGGQRRALAIAEALLDEPDVLLLDDPTQGADAERSAAVAALLRAPTLSEGRVVLFATHDEPLVRAAATRVVRLDRGRVVYDGPPTDAAFDTANAPSAEGNVAK